MACSFQGAVETAVTLLDQYDELHGSADFPTIKGKLMPLIEARAAVDNVYVRRFKESMSPILGQLRRVEEANGLYVPVEQHGVIYLCPSLELEWLRFILVKEASHLLLDSPGDYIHTDTELDELMICLAQFGQEHTTKHYRSEQCALVCAHELLVPRRTRLKLDQAYSDGKVSPAIISKLARVPVDVVRTVMSEEYEAFVRPFYDELS